MKTLSSGASILRFAPLCMLRHVSVGLFGRELYCTSRWVLFVVCTELVWFLFCSEAFPSMMHVCFAVVVIFWLCCCRLPLLDLVDVVFDLALDGAAVFDLDAFSFDLVFILDCWFDLRIWLNCVWLKVFFFFNPS